LRAFVCSNLASGFDEALRLLGIIWRWFGLSGHRKLLSRRPLARYRFGNGAQVPLDFLKVEENAAANSHERKKDPLN
jgi:hypothetical protein